MGFVGRSVKRLEDRPLVTGRGQYAADIGFPHQLTMRMVRSPVANGRLVGIDTSAARALPGVAAVWTFADVRDIPPIDFRLSRIESLAAYRQTILASNRVRYVGDPVAAVFAADAYVAEDAADLVALDIEEAPAVLDPTGAIGAFDERHATEAAVIEKGYGDLDAAFRYRPHRGRGRGRDRPPFRRAVGDPRRHRPPRRGARRARALRRREGAALESRCDRPHARPSAVLGASLRRPRRRRLRHPRRALSRGRAGVSRRTAARRAGEMDRGPPRASHRGEPLAPAGPPPARRGRRGRPRARARRRVLPRPGRLCAHPRRDGARPRRLDAAGTLPAAGLSRRRPHPPHQQDAGRHLSRARPLREHVCARADDGCRRGAARASIRSKCAAAT